MMKTVIFTTTFAELMKHGACTDGYKKLAKSLGGVKKYGDKTPINLLSILASNGVDDCLWSLRAVDHPDRDRISRYIACDCADAVLYIYERDYPNDNRPRLAIQAGRDFADGKITAAARDAAWAAARAAAGAAAWAAARDAAGAAARAAAWDAARAAARDAAWAAAGAAARAAQSEIIRQYFKMIAGRIRR